MHCWSLASQIKCWSASLVQVHSTMFCLFTSMGCLEFGIHNAGYKLNVLRIYTYSNIGKWGTPGTSAGLHWEGVFRKKKKGARLNCQYYHTSCSRRARGAMWKVNYIIAPLNYTTNIWRLQAWAYLGSAWIISNHTYSYHEDWMWRHMPPSLF